VGTDSAASVGRTDLFADARAARALGQLDAGAALRLITLGAAEAIGASDIGVLAPGAWGDVAVVALGRHDETPGRGDVEERVLASDPAVVIATYLAGREVHRRA
jgi:cytosine/adenosine deaminase-related metal-dependent hydrolase